MTDREKIIKGLECCVIHINCSANGGCPYKQSGGTCLNVAIKDALALLKAQEPRIVKISELTSGEPMLVWLEDIDKAETVAGMIFDYVPGRFGFKLTNIDSMDRTYPRIDDYLTRWRCWTSRPSDEVRWATPWE
jgi:hypothetical protein